MLHSGGMNSVGDAIYAGVPMLCAPLFGDQPDNCARVHDRGMGVMVSPRRSERQLGFNADDVGRALSRVLDNAPAERVALRAAWLANMEAGGAVRAACLVEAAAHSGYGAHIRRLPVTYLHPRWLTYGVELQMLTVSVGLCALCTLVSVWKWCCRRSSAHRTTSLIARDGQNAAQNGVEVAANQSANDAHPPILRRRRLHRM